MFKAIFAAISAMFNILETGSRAINRVATTADLYAAQLEAEAKLEVLPVLARSKAKMLELGLTEHDILGTKPKLVDQLTTKPDQLATNPEQPTTKPE